MEKNLKNIQTFEQHTDKNLNISDVSDSSIDITEVIENGDRFERSFFQWLNDNNIGWYQQGSNLNYIQLIDKKNDFSKIQKVWKEVK
jgi:hypothetical protein